MPSHRLYKRATALHDSSRFILVLLLQAALGPQLRERMRAGLAAALVALEGSEELGEVGAIGALADKDAYVLSGVCVGGGRCLPHVGWWWWWW